MLGRPTAIVSVIVATLTGSIATAAPADLALPQSRVANASGARSPTIRFFDDMETSDNGWTHVDNTSGEEPYFNVTAATAFSGAFSWRCGVDDPLLAGGSGYGNDWDQLLSLPAVDASGATQPFLEFAYSTDTESEFDFACVEVESAGAFVRVSPRFAGERPWTSHAGIPLGTGLYDAPLRIRFRFVSDSAWSDEDGGHDSEGGGFHVDNVRVYDAYDGTTLFYDDCEAGGLCTAEVQPPSGDWWHRVERPCAAYSGTHCWWCGDDGDTTAIPAGLDNSLMSPPIDISGSTVCTLRFLIHAEVPTDDDFWTEEISTDGGSTWYITGAWWGDFGECSSWGSHGIRGVDLTPYLPGDVLRFRISMHTNGDGCGPGSLGGAGIMLDDTWVEDWTGSAVQPTSWGSIKAMFR